MSERTAWVDTAKGIGIILMVYGHVARGVERAGITIDRPVFAVVDSVIYSFHMPLFFFLSGLFFVASMEKRGVAGTVSNKLVTLAYPYVVWSLIQGLVEVALSGYSNGHVDLVAVLAIWQPRAQFWFLYALFFVSLLATLVYRLVGPCWYSAVVVVAGLAYVFADILPGGLPLVFLKQEFVFFALGVSFEAMSCDQTGKGAISSVVLIAAFLIGQWLFHGPMGQLATDAPRWSALALAMVSILAVATACRRFGQRAGLLASIGRDSLAIYVMHVIAGSGARIVLQKLLGIESAFVHLVAGTTIGVVLPLLALWTMRRIGIEFLLSPPWLGSARKHARTADSLSGTG